MLSELASKRDHYLLRVRRGGREQIIQKRREEMVRMLERRISMEEIPQGEYTDVGLDLLDHPSKLGEVMERISGEKSG